MKKGITNKLMDWAYNKALNGFGGTESAYTLANNYLVGDGSLSEKVDRLIKWQVTKSATSGFITGLGGLMVIPFSVPANIATVVYIQIRMIAAIAYMGGHDLENDRVKSLIYMCMAGNGAKELIKDSSLKAGESAVRNIAQKASSQVLEKTSTNIATRIGTKGLSNLTKALPVIGGIISGSFDAVSTKITGKVAKKTFINKDFLNQ